MEQQNKSNQESNKLFKLDKTPPKKLKIILRIIAIIYGAVFLLTTLNEWIRGDYEGAKSDAIGAIIIITILIILSFKINKKE